MEERPFKEKTQKPTTALLKKALSSSFKFYESLMEQVKEFSSEWNYSKTSGWMQKIADPKKSICYIIPLDRSYKVNLTLRENEKNLLLNDQTLKSLHSKLTNARKYTEGYLISFHIQNSTEADECKLFITRLINLR